MTLKLDIDAIKSTFYTTVDQSSKWLGRCMVAIKTKTHQALPYLQNRRIAVVTLIALNLLLIEVYNQLLVRVIPKCLPQKSPTQRAFSDAVQVATGLGMVVTSIWSFAKATRLPLSAAAIAGISLITICARASLEDQNA